MTKPVVRKLLKLAKIMVANKRNQKTKVTGSGFINFKNASIGEMYKMFITNGSPLNDSSYHQGIYDRMYQGKIKAQTIKWYAIEVIKESVEKLSRFMWDRQIKPNPDILEHMGMFNLTNILTGNETINQLLPIDIKEKIDMLALADGGPLSDIFRNIAKYRKVDVDKTKLFDYKLTFDKNLPIIKQNMDFIYPILNEEGLVLGHSLPGPTVVKVGDLRLWVDGGWTTLQEVISQFVGTEDEIQFDHATDFPVMGPNQNIRFRFDPSNKTDPKIMFSDNISDASGRSWESMRYITVPYRNLFDRLSEEIELSKSEKLKEELEVVDKLIPDQTLLLRLIDKNGGVPLSSTELRKSEYYRYPYIKQLVDQNKLITRELVLNTELVQPQKSASKKIYDQKIRFNIIPFNSKIQRIFDTPNFSFIVSLKQEDKDNWLKGLRWEGERARALTTLNQHIKDNLHPKINAKDLVLGWVRFTPIESDEYSPITKRDVWIDEIQTDLFSPRLKLDSVVLESLGSMETLLRFITQSFIVTMRKKGKDKFFLPNLQFRKNFYHSNPPKTAYEEVPPKLRFHKIGDGDLLSELSELLLDNSRLPYDPEDGDGDLSVERVKNDVKNRIWVLGKLASATNSGLYEKYKSLPIDEQTGNPVHQFGAANQYRLGSYWSNTVKVPIQELANIKAKVFSKTRIQSIENAMTKGIKLPPIEISLFRDGSGWIVDGNHRLSYYRKKKMPFIEVKFTFVGL